MALSMIPMRCRSHGCKRWTTHPSGMCNEHGPGFAKADPDALTGCADDQTFAAVPVDLLRRIADG